MCQSCQCKQPSAISNSAEEMPTNLQAYFRCCVELQIVPDSNIVNTISQREQIDEKEKRERKERIMIAVISTFHPSFYADDSIVKTKARAGAYFSHVHEFTKSALAVLDKL